MKGRGATADHLSGIRFPLGEFNFYPGIRADAKGNIYVSEWPLGDRFSTLE